MTPEHIFKIQCQAKHMRRSINAISVQLGIEPSEMSMQAFMNLLDEVHESSGNPADPRHILLDLINI